MFSLVSLSFLFLFHFVSSLFSLFFFFSFCTSNPLAFSFHLLVFIRGEGGESHPTLSNRTE
jgi:hypothetical protein